jgi:hypothetical protein
MKANRQNKYKRKKRSCGLCKPHKTGGGHRWKERPSMMASFMDAKDQLRDI